MSADSPAAPVEVASIFGGAATPGAAVSINPEAGWHPVTEDPREREAGVRATDRSLERFPYLAWRFGERGRRFCESDSAWMATLAGDARHAARQLTWLAGVLGARGMPSLCLETHARHLHAELVLAVASRETAYDAILSAADALRASRDAVMPGDALAAIARDFTQRAGDAAPAESRGFGEILAAAVADERAGIPNAVESVLAWAADASRFDARWIEAVLTTVEAARAS
jgi:hypothetical protein